MFLHMSNDISTVLNFTCQHCSKTYRSPYSRVHDVPTTKTIKRISS